MASNKTARYRAKLKAKHLKERMRKSGWLRKKKAGGRMKRVSSPKRPVGFK